MSIRKSMISAVLLVGMIQACGEKKTKEVKADVITTPELSAEQKEEIAAKEAEITFAKKVQEDSLRKVDSLRQVKEHGHAH